MNKDMLYEVRRITDLKDMLSQSRTLYGDKTAYKLKNNTEGYYDISYKELGEHVDRFGGALLELGLKDSYIGIIGENRYEWSVSYLAAVCGAGVCVPIDKELPDDDIINIAEDSELGCIIYSSKNLQQIQSLAQKNSSVKYFICMDDVKEDDRFKSFYSLIENVRQEKVTEFKDIVPDNERLAILLYTSGTTGFSKGVMLSHKNICSNIEAIRKTVYVGPQDSTLSILPIHHTYECTIGFLVMIYSGAAIAFSEGLRQIPKNLKEFKPTLMITVPLLLENVYSKIWDKASKKRGGVLILKIMVFVLNFINNIFRKDLRKKVFVQIYENLGGNIRLIITGAAAIDKKVSRFFRQIGISVLQGYGLTECSPLVAGNRDFCFKDASCGVAIPGVSIKIKNPDSKGNGEIICKGENVMLGYFKNKEATQKVITDGWFHTGDLGRFDRQGFLYITGRSKNVIVAKNGKNIYPEELEASINKNPFVKESLVTGNDETGIFAHIVPNMDAIKEKLKISSISMDEITVLFSDMIKSINKKLPLYKHIKDFTIRENEFVKTTTKKIKRHIENSMDKVSGAIHDRRNEDRNNDDKSE